MSTRFTSNAPRKLSKVDTGHVSISFSRNWSQELLSATLVNSSFVKRPVAPPVVSIPVTLSSFNVFSLVVTLFEIKLKSVT